MYGTVITNALMVFLSLVMILAPIFLLVMVFLIPFCPDKVCDGYWERFPFLLLQALAIPAGFFVVAMIVVTSEMGGYLSEHFDEYKCSPWLMPFVSWIRPDVSTTHNFEQCLGSVSRVVQGALMTPMVDLASELNGGQNLQAENVDRIQQSLANKQHSTAQLFFSMNNQMGAMQAIGKTLMIKIGALFTNIMELVYDLYYALLSMASFYESLICMPQMILVYMMALGATLLTAGGVEMISGTLMAGDGVVTSAVGASMQAIVLPPVIPILGTAAEIAGDLLIGDGDTLFGMGASLVVFGTILLTVGGFFFTNLKLATTANNDLISAQMEQLEQAQAHQEMLASQVLS